MKTQSIVLELLYTDKCGEGNRCSYESFCCEHTKIRETFPYGSSKCASEKFVVPINKLIYDYSSCNCEIFGKTVQVVNLLHVLGQ
jgi:hypothetical protein